jgi:hypothetical protein
MPLNSHSSAPAASSPSQMRASRRYLMARALNSGATVLAES